MKELDNNKFLIEDENGQTKEAEIITMISMGENKYLIYSIIDNNMSLVCASRVIKNENGTDKLINLEEGEDKEKIKSFIQSLSK